MATTQFKRSPLPPDDAEPRGSASRDRADDQEWLPPGDDQVGQRRIRRLVGEVLLASEESQKRAPPPGRLVADRSPQHRIFRLERVEHRALSDRVADLDLHLTTNASQGPQVRRQNDPDQASVCTCTERTAGRSRTMGFQLSPASADPYTWPPLVPK